MFSRPQAGPFPVGNLLDYANSDFEGHANFLAVSNARIADDSSVAFLHSASLSDTAPAAGSSAFKLQEGSVATSIPVTGGHTYSLSAYVRLSGSQAGQTLQFGVGCYDSMGLWLGWASTPALALQGSSAWRYAQGEVTVPAGCSQAVDSPKLTFAGLSAGEHVNVDELAFRPYRAALVIGMHGNNADDGNNSYYSATDWLDTNRAIGQGHFQDDKQFYLVGQSLSPQWASSSNRCYLIEQALPQNQWPECLITYKVQESEAQLQAFFRGMPAAQQVVMIFWQEPENDTFSGCTSGGSGPNFVCEFEKQSVATRQAAAADGVAQNVLVADDAMDYSYDPAPDSSPETGELDDVGVFQTGTSCSFIVPARFVDMYLDDHYAYNATGDMASGPGARTDNFQQWLSCVLPRQKPIGLAEYGVDRPGSTDYPYQGAAIAADTSYLAQLYRQTGEEMTLWSYWDSGWTIDQNAAAVSAWRAAETQNSP